ncbi:MAG: HK97 gp10 family phage protein [Paeniclostridium sordellii]|nr:HK97 gp10 family phage protein [Paeniclostridium sordellii]
MGLTFDSSSLMEALQNLETKVANDIGKEALIEGAEPILKEMQKNVPVAEKDGGQLKFSLQIGKITGSAKNGTMRIKVGINPSAYDQVKYGFYQEYGTGVMLGKGWMSKSWNNSIKESKARIEEVVKKELNLR